MTRSVPAGLPPPGGPRPGPGLPSSGVAAVARLAVPPAREQVPLAQVQETLELGLDPVRLRRPQLRLVTRDGTDLDQFVARFARVVVEVLAGDRGAHQLLRWTTEEVYDGLLRRASALQRAAANGQPRRRLRAQVRSVHVCRPHPGAAELSIHVRHGARSRAIAARIELIEERWRCSVLQFG